MDLIMHDESGNFSSAKTQVIVLLKDRLNIELREVDLAINIENIPLVNWYPDNANIKGRQLDNKFTRTRDPSIHNC